MNTRNLLFAVTGLAAGLALGYFAAPRSAPAPGASPVPEVSSAAATTPIAVRAAEKKPRSTVLTNTVTQRIDWRMVESEDYKKYIANLRSIGCPEETIRDIITADVNKLFAARHKEISGAGTNKFEYWKGGMQMFAKAFDEDKIKKQQELAKEKRALLTELLGSAPEEKLDMTAMMGGVNPFEQMLDFLTPDKQTTAMEVMQKYQAKMMKGMGSGAMDADGLKEMTKIQKEMEAELGKTLSPQELEEYNLRMSNTANIMRFTLASFDPNEQEFRDIFKQRKVFDDQFGPFGQKPDDKVEAAKYDAAKKQMDEQLKQTLGPRYADYERSQDYNYQQLYAIGQRNGLPKEATISAYDMKKVAEDQAKLVRNDKALSNDQRTAALQAIREETQRSLQGVLGDKAYTSYQKNAWWLKGISPDPKKTP
ncbi:MAG: hypothetical protein HZA89_15055 [Verrucomicrobia bacterium]|nr:hypothetical protein [Verrucomicrobiota bacterium]